jgi:CheY-like chemotaxis protein
MSRRTEFGTRLTFTAVALFCLSLSGASPDPAAGSGDNPLPRDFTFRQRQLDRTREGRELYRKRVSLPDASEAGAPRAPWLHTGSLRSQPSIQFDAPATGLSALLQSCLIAGVVIFGAIRFSRKYGLRVADFAGATFWPSEANAAGGLSTKVRAEEVAFSEFVSAFRVGLAKPAASDAAALKGDDGIAAAIEKEREESSTKAFFEWAPAQLAKLKGMLPELSRSAVNDERQGLLEELADEVQTLHGRADVPKLLTFWQITAALEGLLRQFIRQKNTITPSTLRTVACALDLLGELCQRGWTADSAPLTSARLLVVDDDLISRRAVSFALKRAFNQPDLAENGEAALSLAEKQRYDMVFLDVQMPGMDGYEVCSKIHATAANRTTPVVFVTCHSDFQDRTKAIVSGGNDLIAKPFLSFELTLKALVSILRARLLEEKSGATAAASPQPSQAEPPKPAEDSPKNSSKRITGPANRGSATRISRRPDEKSDDSASLSFRSHRQCQPL